MSALQDATDNVLSVFGVRNRDKQPKYEVLEVLGEAIEVRRYAPRIAAQSIVKAASDREARVSKFNVLFRYISGRYDGGSKIAMTVPVENRIAAPQGAKIAMTTPVDAESLGDNRYAMRFFLPREYTAETAPKPLDQRAEIITLPEGTFAAIRFSGAWSQQLFVEKRGVLLNALRNSTWYPVSDATTFFYDPPFTPPFLRRNEVAVRVERAAGAANSASARVAA